VRGASSSSASLSPWWTLVLPFLTLLVLLLTSAERRLWVALFSTAVFVCLQWMLPQCRFRIDNYLGPVNVALTLFFIKLVVGPALIMLTGAESKVLSYLPTVESMQKAILIDVVAYVAFCLGLSCARPEGSNGRLRPSWLAGPSPSDRIVLVFAALGVAGFLAAFGSPGRIIQYFLDPTSELREDLDGGLVALSGTILRPFLAFALVAWWANRVDSSKGRDRLWRSTVEGLAVALGVTFANLTFSFNRAAFVFPLTALIATYSARVKRVPVSLTALMIVAALPVLMALGTMRSNRIAKAETDTDAALESVVKDASETILAYSGGPQYSALFCERIGWGDHLYHGTTLVASVLSPVPIIGKDFRESNGPALFNRALYDVRDIEDQIIPFSIELFANFHLPGVVAGFFGLGVLLVAAQQQFKRASSTFAAFSIQYVAIWGAMLAAWSVSIYAQILIYFFGPIYFYIASRHVLGWLHRMSGKRPVASVEARAAS
jgi:hypothetical protein